MKNFKELEQSAWEHYLNQDLTMGNAHHYEDAQIHFNGKESIVLWDAAQKGREEFIKVFQHYHYRFLYYESLR